MSTKSHIVPHPDYYIFYHSDKDMMGVVLRSEVAAVPFVTDDSFRKAVWCESFKDACEATWDLDKASKLVRSIKDPDAGKINMRTGYAILKPVGDFLYTDGT